MYYRNPKQSQIEPFETDDRPCSGCLKKGFAPDQCIDGCENCRRARVRCEEGNTKPCKKCREENLECVDESMVGAPVRQVDPSGASTSTRVAREKRLNLSERAKLACQACRRDNKKVRLSDPISN